ncbi:hypothetical protein BGZ60DRAFT_407207 [Tricladium varicosporioides]|nr:hypothetical protein BGZ60DRAFT_407207 [Hymenoscyphus varicosporioides]
MALVTNSLASENHFHLFPDLPPEIRHLIWVFTFPAPRKVGPDHDKHLNAIKLCRSPDPIALRISRESRSVALRYYTKKQEVYSVTKERWQSVQRTCLTQSCNQYIDFQHDIFLFPDMQENFHVHHLPGFSSYGTHAIVYPPFEEQLSERFFTPAEMVKIENVQIFCQEFLLSREGLTEWLELWLPLFKSLKSLSLKALTFHITNAGRERDEDEELEIKFKEYHQLINNFMQKADCGGKLSKAVEIKLEAVDAPREDGWFFDIM